MNSPHQPVTATEIADLLAQARSLTQARSAADPTTRAAYLAAKADLLTRIADEHADDDRPCQLSTHARHIAAHARIAAESARTHPRTPK